MEKKCRTKKPSKRHRHEQQRRSQRQRRGRAGQTHARERRTRRDGAFFFVVLSWSSSWSCSFSNRISLFNRRRELETKNLNDLKRERSLRRGRRRAKRRRAKEGGSLSSRSFFCLPRRLVRIVENENDV